MRSDASPGVAVVTGASSGIGEAFARALSSRGFALVLVARRRQRLEVLAKEIGQAGGRAEVLIADLTDSVARTRVEERLATTPDVAALINNAGFGTAGRFDETEVGRLESELRLNVVASMRLARTVLPNMRLRGSGWVVNVSSAMGFQPDPWCAHYGATKAYLTSLSLALADECRGSGICVQALCPGPVRTDFAGRAGIDLARFPAFTLLSPEQVVAESLRAIERGRSLCIPGVAMRTTARITSVLPPALTRLFYREFGRFFYRG